MTANVAEAIRSGIKMGFNISLNPFTQSPLMTQDREPFNPTETAWKQTGEALRQAMNTEAEAQKSLHSQ